MVAITGDAVDRDNRVLESFGPLERGIRELAAAGIHVCAVAGNHDYDAFASLAEALDPTHFHFLGRGGRWNRYTLRRDGQPVLHVDGWSFPEVRYFDDPLDLYNLPPPDDAAPLVGILHTALDATDGPYAPVHLARLRTFPRAIWMLGHYHYPRLRDDGGMPYVLYPGQPQAMAIRESGKHGIWFIDIEPGAPPHCRFMPLSTLWFDGIHVPLDGSHSPEAVRNATIEAIRRHAEAIVPDAPLVQLLVCRPMFSGRTRMHRELPTLAAALRDNLRVPCGRFEAVIEKTFDCTQPDLDLGALAGGQGLPASLARLALALAAPDGCELSAEHAKVLDAAATAMREVDSGSAYARLSSAMPQDAEVRRRHVRQVVHHQALTLLDELLSQTREVSA